MNTGVVWVVVGFLVVVLVWFFVVRGIAQRKLNKQLDEMHARFVADGLSRMAERGQRSSSLSGRVSSVRIGPDAVSAERVPSLGSGGVVGPGGARSGLDEPVSGDAPARGGA